MIDVTKMMAYEDGEMDYEQVVEFFQELVDTGLVWSLQGHYGRTAVQMIASGDVVRS